VGKGEGSVPFEEEKRLCYVAMTRAKSELFMSWRQNVPMFSSEGLKTVERPRSRFLDVLVAKKPVASSKLSTEKAMTPKRNNWKKKYRSVQDQANQIKNWISSYNLRKFGTVSSEKFTGTASVYTSSNTNKKTEMKVEKLSTKTIIPKRPSAPLLVPKDQQVSSSVQAQRVAVDSMSIREPSPTKNSPPNKSIETRRETQQTIDSSWFFPIGSRVRHKLFGDGVVLTPLTSPSVESKMNVLVEFKNGEKKEFPVQTTELSPIVTK
jgi:ATP-dependent exoDNAse (exonuclease V) beta subunit